MRSQSLPIGWTTGQNPSLVVASDDNDTERIDVRLAVRFRNAHILGFNRSEAGDSNKVDEFIKSENFSFVKTPSPENNRQNVS